MVRLGIIGCNFGRTVHLPAFRNDSRCDVVALAGTDATRTDALAREAGVQLAFGDWRALVDHGGVDAVAIAVPPGNQPEIAVRALAAGKPVFLEKPLAADLAGAAAVLRQANASRLPTMIDFEFTELPAWKQAKAMLDRGALGRLRHVIVTWNVENAATRLRLRSWKTDATSGGGVLGNFASHCFNYLEWFCGPIAGLSARLFPLTDSDTGEACTVALAMSFASGVGASLTVSCASYLGSGHRLELYGEAGTLVLHNPTADYIRGFELFHAQRPAAQLARIAVDDPLLDRFADGRIAAVSRLASRFLDSIESGVPSAPGVAEGYGAQQLMAAAERSHQLGRWIDLASGDAAGVRS